MSTIRYATNAKVENNSFVNPSDIFKNVVPKNSPLIKETGLPKQTVTSIVNKLSREEKIVTFPDPTDKRSKILYLNEVGQEQTRAVLTELRTKELKAAQALGIEKLRLLNDLTSRLNLLTIEVTVCLGRPVSFIKHVSGNLKSCVSNTINTYSNDDVSR